MLFLCFFLFLLVLSCIIRFVVVYYFDLVGNKFFGGGDIGSENWRKTFNLLYDNLYTRYGSLLVGVIGSYLYVFHSKKLSLFFSSPRLSRPLYFISVFLLFCIFFRIDYFYFSTISMSGIQITASDLSFFEKIYFSFIVSVSRNLFSLCVVYILFYIMFSKKGKGSSLNRFLSHKSLFPVAQISYSAYLIHPIIIIPVCRYFSSPIFSATNSVFVVFVINSAVSLFFIFVFSLLLYLYIERPGINLRNHTFFKSFIN